MNKLNGMRRWIKIAVVWLGIMIIGGANAALAIDAKLAQLNLNTSNAYLVLSATLELPFDGKLEETIHSGIDTTFVFRIELLRERFWWFDEEILAQEVIHTVIYDTLSKQYTLRVSDKYNEQALVTSNFDEMKTLMTGLVDIKVIPFKHIKPQENYYIRVMSEMEALQMPFPLEYIPFIASLQEFETPWAIAPLTTIQHKD